MEPGTTGTLLGALVYSWSAASEPLVRQYLWQLDNPCAVGPPTFEESTWFIKLFNIFQPQQVASHTATVLLGNTASTECV